MGRSSSVVWNFFDVVDKDKKLSVCKTCKRRLSYKTTITNLKQHLKLKHPDQLEILNNIMANESHITVSNTEDPVYAIIVSKDEESSEIKEIRIDNSDHHNNDSSDGDPFKKISMQSDSFSEESRSLEKSSYEPSSKKIKLENKNNIDFHLLKMIIYDFQPFSVIDDIGFRSLIHALNPTYEIPDRRELSLNLLSMIYERRLEDLKSYVSQNAKTVAITMDCWTSISMVNHMALTAHFVTEKTVELKSVMLQCSRYEACLSEIEIYREIKGILEYWELYDKTKVIVTNCKSPNMLGALNYLESDGITQFDCLGYKLNEIVENSLGEIKIILDKVRKVVNFFRQTSLAKESLINYQITHQNTLTPKTLLKSFPKIWNSTYLMLERFVELKKPIKVTIMKLDLNFLEIDDEEWKIIEQICVVLKPFYEATNEMYAETYVVASKAITLVSSLMSICQNYTKLKDLHPPMKRLTQKLKDGLENQLGDLELNTKIGLSMVLDPRFKLKPIKNRDNILKIKTIVISELTEEMERRPQLICSTPSTSKTTNVGHGSDIPSYSLWNEFDNESITPPKPPMTRAAEELDKFISEPLLKRTKCPYKWWREHRFLYPTLFELFMQHCNIMLNAVPCERIFSKSGFLVNDRRTRLSTSKVAKIMFLNANKMDLDSEVLL